MESFTKLMELVFRYEFGSDYFYIMLATTLVLLCGISWLLAKIFGGGAGLIVASIATVLPLLLGAAGFVLTEVYLVPLLDPSHLRTYLPWGVLGIVFFLTIILPTKKMLGVGGFLAVFIFVMASAAAGIAYVGADSLINMADKGGEQTQKHKSRTIDQIVD